MQSDSRSDESPRDVAWREYLFTEFHLHSAHNFYPQRTIRSSRCKLIHNLMPRQTNPGYEFTLKRFFPDLHKAIDAAPEEVRDAYRRMHKPPEFELYDLESDPYEFRNLAGDEAHSTVEDKLKRQLSAWRERTNDPLLDLKNLTRLKSDIDACFDDDGPNKKRLKLSYPDYFFSLDRNPTRK